MNTRPLQTVTGSCHCQSVRFSIETDFPELTTCDCSICRRKNALMVKVHESKLTLLAGEDALTEYQFHTRTARHYFCASCGQRYCGVADITACTLRAAACSAARV